MTQFMQKSFSVYANREPYTCDKCHKEAQTFYIRGKERVCYDCEKKVQETKKPVQLP